MKTKLATIERLHDDMLLVDHCGVALCRAKRTEAWTDAMMARKLESVADILSVTVDWENSEVSKPE